LLAISDLYLLRSNLQQLRDTAYFNSELEAYAKGLIAAIDYVLAVGSTQEDEVIRLFKSFVWDAHQYLSGSVTKEIPYELEFVLQEALREWMQEGAAITTALLPNLSYQFQPFDHWQSIKVLFPDFRFPEFDSVLIQIALPRLYRDKPLFNVPLYHELGHFIDQKFNISSQATLLKYSDKDAPEADREYIHRKEFFADLFAACYIGEANGRVLSEMAPGDKDTDTHPSTVTRMRLVSDFLNDRPNEEVSWFQSAIGSLNQSALGSLRLPYLKKRFKKPAGLVEAFNDLRPCPIVDNEELHGIFEAGLEYLFKIRSAPEGAWIGMDPAEIDATVNDLVEKSIRTVSITRKWQNAAPGSQAV
jgi:hypothetical protein